MEAEKEKTEEKPPQEQPQPPQEQPQPQTTTEVPPTSTEPPANPSELTQEKKDTSKYIFHFILSYYNLIISHQENI